MLKMCTWKNHWRHLAWGKLYCRRERNIHLLKEIKVFILRLKL